MSDQHRVVRPEAIAFGALLARLREDRGLSQKDLAVSANVSPSTITRVESQERGVSREVVDRLADALGLSNADRVELLLAAGVVDDDTATLLRSPSLAQLARVLALPEMRRQDRAQLLLYVDLALAFADALGYLVPAAWQAAPGTDADAGAAAPDGTNFALDSAPIDVP